MKLVRTTFEHRHDFEGVFKCEHCGHEMRAWGYDDSNFFNNVIPNVQCPHCNLNSHGETFEETKARLGRTHNFL